MNESVDDMRKSDLVSHGLKQRHVTMITFGGMIGAGLFVGSGSALHNAGPGVVAVYLAVGLIVYLIMRMLGEMATSRPISGTFVEYTAASLGPWAGFLTGWMYWYFWVFTIGAETVAGANLLRDIGLDLPTWAIGVGIILVLAATNALSVKAYGEVEFWLASIKVFSIIGFIATAAIFIIGGRGVDLDPLSTGQGLFPHGVGGLLAAVPVVVFSMVGSEIAAVAAAESDRPAENIARAARSVALRTILFYVCSVGAIALIITPAEALPGLSPFSIALRKTGVPGADVVMTWVVITAVLSCLNSGLYITSRMLFSLGSSGHAPRLFSRTNSRKVPVWGLLVGLIAGIAAAFGQMFMDGDAFSLLAGASGNIILFIYALIILAEIKQRTDMERAGDAIKCGVPLFPFLSWATLVSIFAIVGFLAMDVNQRETLVISLASICILFVAMGMRTMMTQHSKG